MLHEILPNGDLKIYATPEWLADLREKYAGTEEDQWGGGEDGSIRYRRDYAVYSTEADTMDAYYEEFEGILTNTEIESLLPEYILALTDDPYMWAVYGEDTALSEGADPAFYRIIGRWENNEGDLVTYYNPVLNAWHFPMYCLRSPLNDVLENGFAIFEKIPLDVETGDGSVE